MLDPLEGLRTALADRYIIDREIGHGGTATVYLARDRKLPRTVAIKVLDPELALAVRTERFLREIQIAARLQHPHILPLHDSGEVDGLPYYVMPYVAGETLRDRLGREGPLPLDQAIRITDQVASALGYAHEQGVIHRDIKPANILLSAGHAVVADFGIARAFDAAGSGELTQTGVSLGTPAYMSPEQASGQPLDNRTDIYSLGCVLYEMLAGRPPFVGPSPQALIAQHLVDNPRPLRYSRPNLPGYVHAAIDKALSKNPDERFETAIAFANALSTPRAPNWRDALPSFRLAGSAIVLLGIGTALVWAVRVGLPSRSHSAAVGAGSGAMGQLLSGRTQFWEGDLDGAATAYRKAIAADSDLALAYDRLSVVETWRWDYPAARRAVEAGLARPGLSPKWRALLEAQRQYVSRNCDSAIAAFQVITTDYPELLDGWLGLGEAIYHYGGFAGQSPSNAAPIFERLVTKDSTFAPIYDHLVTLAIYARDSVRARRYVSHIRAADDREGTRSRIATTLAFGNPEARTRALTSLRVADRAPVSLLVALFGHAATDLPLVDTIAGYLLRSERTMDDRRRGAQYRFVALAALGQWPGALATWDSVAGGAQFDHWIIQAYFAGFPVKRVAEPMFTWARTQVARGYAPDFTKALTDQSQQAFQALAHRAVTEGDSSQVLALLRHLDRTARFADPSDPLPANLRAALQSRLAMLGGDTARTIDLLEQALSRSGEPAGTFYPLVTMAPERWLLANLLTLRGQTRAARQWLDSFENTWSYGDALYNAKIGCLRTLLDARIGAAEHDGRQKCDRWSFPFSRRS